MSVNSTMTKMLLRLLPNRIIEIIPRLRKNNHFCYDCNKKTIITKDEERYANYHFGRPLCRMHQSSILKKITPEAKELYKELKRQGIGECSLEFFDGFKSVDLCIPWAGLDLEIDGKHHLLDPKQLFTDIKRAHYSKENDNYETIHIPNNLINDNIKELAATIIKVSKNRYRENKQENSILNQIGEVCFFILCTFIIYLIWHIILHYLGLVN